jgi:hypothetical protein
MEAPDAPRVSHVPSTLPSPGTPSNLRRRGTKRRESNNTTSTTSKKKSKVIINHNNPCHGLDPAMFDTKKEIKDNNITKMRNDMFNCIAARNTYVDTCERNPQKDTNSFYSLIKQQLSQSDAIKLGFAIEKIFREMILSNPELEDIRNTKTIKGVKEKDHLFRHTQTGDIYYAEVKSSLLLDTEKFPATIAKIKDITRKLQSTYASKNINAFLFTPRYLLNDLIPEAIQKKLESYDTKGIKIVGVNDYLDALGVKYQFLNEKSYMENLEFLVYRMYECPRFNEVSPEIQDRIAFAEEYIPSASKHKTRMFDTNNKKMQPAEGDNFKPKILDFDDLGITNTQLQHSSNA